MTAADSLVELTANAGVWTIRLCDPRRRNALSHRMRNQLLTAVVTAIEDADCRCIVLRGAGGHFCAGGDLRELADVSSARARLTVLNQVVERLATASTPVIAAVEGAAVGSGLSLAMACDVVVAVPSATLRASFARVGLAADGGITWSLRRRLGAARARAFLLSAATVDGAQAQASGFVDVLCEDGALDATVARLTSDLASGAPLALQALKALDATEVASLRQALGEELDVQLRLMRTEDFTEGRKAVLENRPPVFNGH